VPIGDATLGEVIRGHFDGDAIACQNPNSVPAKLPSQMCQNRPFLVQLDTEQTARKLFHNSSSYFNTVFFTHSPLVLVYGRKQDIKKGRYQKYIAVFAY
jgi:hypothetical protein